MNTHYCFLPIPEVIKKPRMVDPRSNMYQRCVTSTGQPEFQAPNCDNKGSGVGAGWKAGAGTKGSGGGAPHPPPERKKSLNLRLEKVDNNSPSGSYASSSCGSEPHMHAPKCAAAKPGPRSCASKPGPCTPTPSWGGGSSGHSSGHEPGCPMNQGKPSAPSDGSCHDPHCPIQRH